MMQGLSSSLRAWVLPAASFLAACFALTAYFGSGSGVDHTPGALLVNVSLGLLLLAGLVLALGWASGGARVALLALALLDIVGTLAAAYLLHAWIVLALTGVSLLGWLLLLPGATSTQRQEAAA